MKLFNKWNLKKHFIMSLVVSFFIGIVGEYLITASVSSQPKTTENSVSISFIMGSSIDMIMTISILVFLIVLVLYKPIKKAINK
jgi:uncharacterized membrane protein YesL